MLILAIVSGLGARIGGSTGLLGDESGSDDRLSGAGRLKGAEVEVSGTAALMGLEMGTNLR